MVLSGAWESCMVVDHCFQVLSDGPDSRPAVVEDQTWWQLLAPLSKSDVVEAMHSSTPGTDKLSADDILQKSILLIAPLLSLIIMTLVPKNNKEQKLSDLHTIMI